MLQEELEEIMKKERKKEIMKERKKERNYERKKVIKVSRKTRLVNHKLGQINLLICLSKKPG